MEQTNTISLFLNKNRDYSGLNNLTKFNGYNGNIYIDPAITGNGFIFITKPSLFINPQKPAINDANKILAYQNMCKDPAFSSFIVGENANEKDLIIAKQLSYYSFGMGLLLPIFTNLSNSFSPTDTTMGTTNSYNTRSGYSIPTPTTKNDSESAGSISINVNETDNMDFLKMLKLWVKYIANITDGTFYANPEMINNNMLDYTCSIYYFMLGPDGRTLKYWCRYTSCFPTTIPYSALSYQKDVHGEIYYDINFQYTHKEDMDPRILEDFNLISLNLVNPTFTNTNYTNFLNQTSEKEVNGYTSYTTGSLLSKEILKSSSVSKYLNEDDRTPIIFYEQPYDSSTNIDRTIGKYVLSFGNSTLSNSYLNTLVEDPNAFTYKDLRDTF